MAAHAGRAAAADRGRGGGERHGPAGRLAGLASVGGLRRAAGRGRPGGREPAGGRTDARPSSTNGGRAARRRAPARSSSPATSDRAATATPCRDRCRSARPTTTTRRRSRRWRAPGVDLLLPLTMTSLPETVGIVRAAERAGLPVLVSPTIEPDGRLPDGTPLGDFVAAVDEQTSGTPVGYMVNCVHPSHLAPVLGAAAEPARPGWPASAACAPTRRPRRTPSSTTAPRWIAAIRPPSGAASPTCSATTGSRSWAAAAAPTPSTWPASPPPAAETRPGPSRKTIAHVA